MLGINMKGTEFGWLFIATGLKENEICAYLSFLGASLVLWHVGH
jgi:Sec-independent protein secretion pathway component TatC